MKREDQLATSRPVSTLGAAPFKLTTNPHMQRKRLVAERQGDVAVLRWDAVKQYVGSTADRVKTGVGKSLLHHWETLWLYTSYPLKVRTCK